MTTLRSEGAARPNAVLIFVLSVVLGFLGVDRFVNGNVVAGIIKLLTVGGFGIWWLVDIVIFGVRAFTGAGSSGGRSAGWTAQSRTESDGPSETSARERRSDDSRIPPAPRGTAVEPWVASKNTQEVVGEYYRSSTYDTLLAGQARTGQNIRLDRLAALYPDPFNPYSDGSAVAVWIDGMHAGYLPAEVASAYSPVLRRLAEQEARYIQVPAQVRAWYQTRNQRWEAQTGLVLPEPPGLVPANSMPDGDVEVIPSGRPIKVAKTGEHMDVLGSRASVGADIGFAVTLRPAWSGARGDVRTVEVLLDGELIGEFSSQSGAQTVELVQLILRAGRTPVARASIQGNQLGADVAVRMQRTAEFDHRRIEDLALIARERAASTTHRGEQFEWDDDVDEPPAQA